MNETVLKQDVGVTYKVELVNCHGHVEVSFEGCRQAVETKLKTWIPTLMHGDTIRFVNKDKETE
jgi:hypothetical protein